MVPDDVGVVLFVCGVFFFWGGGVCLCFFGLILYIVESVCCAQCIHVCGEIERERDEFTEQVNTYIYIYSFCEFIYIGTGSS